MKPRVALLAAVLLAATLSACSGSYTFELSENGNYRFIRHGMSSLPPQAADTARYVVVLQPDTPDVASAAAKLTAPLGVRPERTYTHALKGFAATLPVQAASALARNPLVDYVEPDLVFSIGAKPPKPPPSGDELPWGVDRIDAEKNGGAKGAGVAVAVLDTGIDTDHPDLAANYQGGYDFVNGDGLPEDDNGHGTHVSGIIAADNNSAGIVGVAPNAGIVAVKVLDSNGEGYLSVIIDGIDWVIANQSGYGIKVANMSFGGSGSSEALHTAVQGLYNAGVTIAASAGNNRSNAAYFIPAAYAEVLCISALASGDKFASYSNYGSVVDLIAPGSDVKSTWPGGGFATLSGTSMAAPHVAGAAALYLDNHEATPAEVMQALLATGEKPKRGKWPGDPDGIAEPLVDAEPL